ncbi:MAG: hypothetical protein HUU57_12715 [Bdellovibrio sp.]|nr:hypothetical protein [Bdellovibrio sp.]
MCSVTGIYKEPVQTDQDGINFTSEQLRALRLCTFITVQDEARAPLEFRQTPLCKIIREEGGILRLEGTLCFLRIRPNNRFAVSMALKEECKSQKFLDENNIEPQDLNIALNSYVTGDDTGVSTDVTPIGSVPNRIFIQPPTGLLPLNEDQGLETPRFISDYNGDIQMGQLNISGEDLTFHIDPYVYFNNNTPKHCKAGVCSSPSHFNLPFAGEFELREISGGGKTRFIDSWWGGTMVKPHWQGLLRLQGHAIEESEIREGRRYSLTLTMIDPTEDFFIFISDFTQFLINLNDINGTAGIDSLTGIGGLSGLGGIPGLPILPGLPATRDLNGTISQVIKALQKLGKSRDWPGYYDRVCSLDYKDCMLAGKSKYFLKLQTEFTLGPRDPETNYFTMKNVVVKRDSPVMEAYNRTLPKLPHLKCQE